MRAVKSVSIDSDRRVIITFLDGSTETLYPNLIWCDAEALKEIIKELLEQKADAIVQTINNVTIASFEDGADEALIRKLLVSIEPVQEGEGDPSPENVRPISGRTGLSVFRTGKNLFNGQIRSSSTAAGITSVVEKDNHIIASGSSTGNGDIMIYLANDPVLLKAGQPYTFSLTGKDTRDDRLVLYLGSTVFITIGAIPNTSHSVTFTLATDLTVSRLILRTTRNNTVDIDAKFQLELGSATTDYEPYQGDTYSVNWETEAGTVYGGYVDVVSGKLTVDSGYIASYNGEVLPSTWISDRDVYIEGTVPTTGAQVVYQLSDPVVYLLTPQEITTLLGTNNIWVDSGDILELEYVADTKLYIGEQQSGKLGTASQSITNNEIQPVSEKTWEELPEAYKAETEEKETQEETEDERGE